MKKMNDNVSIKKPPIKEAFTIDVEYEKWHKERIQLSTKQMLAFKYLTDNKTKTLVYWGAWWGWKTVLWAFWIVSQAFAIPWSHWIVCRALKTTLRDSTLLSFFKVMWEMWITDKSYHWDKQAMTMTFSNWSIVWFRWLEYEPSDPMFEKRLQGLEITWWWIDEATEVPEVAYSTIHFTRTRHMVDVIWIPKMLLTCNPNRTSYIYSMFYKPFTTWTLLPEHKFIKALPHDNPWLDATYIDWMLHNPNKVSVQRMYYGNWEYDDSPALLFDYTLLNRMYNWDSEEICDTYYLAIDPARKGRDKTVIWVWKGYELIDILEWVHCPKIYESFPLKYTEMMIKDLKRKYSIPNTCMSIDSDWVGWGLADMFPWSINIINNASAIQPKRVKDNLDKYNYANLKTQLYFKLQELASQDVIKIKTDKSKQDIEEELGIVAQKDIDKDGKIQLESKKDMKAIIWRSPDFADMLAYRMIFELKTRRKVETFIL